MKESHLLTTLLFVLPIPLLASFELWSVELPPPQSDDHYIIKIGNDGSLTASDGSKDIYWYNENGQLNHEIRNDPDSIFANYVSSKFLIVWVDDYPNLYSRSYKMVNGSVQIEDITTRESSGFLYNTLEFPFYASQEILGSGNSKISMHSLVSTDSNSIVGKMSSGVHGTNLQVRWESSVGGQYTVQTSTDLTTWEDSIGPLTGTGSEIAVNIPLPADSDRVFARVIQEQ